MLITGPTDPTESLPSIGRISGGGVDLDAGTTDRAQTEVLGAALLIGIVVISTTILAIFGTAAITEGQDEISIPQAERALEALDSRASSVAFGDSSTQEVDLGLAGSKGSLSTEPDAGWLSVRTDYPVNTTKNDVIANETLGAVVYRQADTSLAYQGGGIWRSDGEGSVMRASPEFHFQDNTLTLPIVVTKGDGAVYSKVQITRDGDVIRFFPNKSANPPLVNKLNRPVIEVTVQSEYYEAWADFFWQETTGWVDVNHSNQTATLRIATTSGIRKPAAGLVATSGASEFRVQGSNSYVDSYNSSIGPYSSTEGTNATLLAAGDITLEGGSEVEGNVTSGRNVTLDGGPTVTGDLEYTVAIKNQTGNPTVGGDVRQIDGVDTIEPIDPFMDQLLEASQTANDNGQTPVIESATLNQSELPGELGPGRYYLESLTLDTNTETLDLNTTNGDITIVVRDYVDLRTGGELQVTGDGTARIFIASRGTTHQNIPGVPVSDHNFLVYKDAKMTTPGQISTQLQIFGPSYFNGSMVGQGGNPVTVEGLIYAPAGREGTGAFYIRDSGLFGGIAAGEVDGENKAEIHFDESILNAEIDIYPGSSPPRIDFLHVTRRQINVTSTPP